MVAVGNEQPLALRVGQDLAGKSQRGFGGGILLQVEPQRRLVRGEGKRSAEAGQAFGAFFDRRLRRHRVDREVTVERRRVGVARRVDLAQVERVLALLQVIDPDRGDPVGIDLRLAGGEGGAIEGAFLSIRQATALTTDVVAWGAEVQSVVYLPHPGDAAPRYSITVLITCRSTAAV